AGAEKASEEEERVGVGRDWSIGGAPGEVVLVSAGIAGMGIDGFAHGIAGEFQRRKTSEMPELGRGHLVEGYAGLRVRTGGRVQADNREERATGAGVVAGAVGAGGGIDVIESSHDVELMFHALQGLQGAAQIEVAAFACGPPVGLDGAVGEINEG